MTEGRAHTREAGFDGQRVLYVQYSDPAAYPPVEHGARLLSDAGCEVLLLGIDLFQGKLEPISGARIETRIIPAAEPGWRQKVHYLRFLWWVVRTSRRWSATWVYASDPLACAPAWVLSCLGVKLVYHEHDSPDPGDRPASLFMRLVLSARRAAARRASVCVLPNAQRAAEFAAQTGTQDVLTVWNCPLVREVTGGQPRAGRRLRVLYHGSIVPARLPVSVVQALGRTLADVELIVAGYETAGRPDYVRELRTAAVEAGVGDRVTIAGTLPTRAGLLSLCATCDVGLALMPSASGFYNERTMTGASNKPFDYLANGLALLVTDRPDWRTLFVDQGYGLACEPESADSIAAALAWFAEHADERRRMGERGRERIEREWNYETAFAPVMQHMVRALEPSGPAPAEARAAL